MASKKSHLSEVFTRTRCYLRRFVELSDMAADVVTIWIMHTWLFSPACEQPATTPYLYIAAPKGSGKTVLGQDVMGSICRNHLSTVGITGAGVARIVGGFAEDNVDDEAPVSSMPTLAIDEIDALYSGSKDEMLRMMLNAGYRRGASIPRVVGTETIMLQVYCPKILMGIDNGHLPDTILDRSIRISLHQARPQEPFYNFETEDEAAELSEELAQWAKDHSQEIRDYRPSNDEDLKPRQFEIARTLYQVAHAVGNEKEIRAAILELFNEKHAQDPRIRMYEVIRDLFAELETDRLTNGQILERLIQEGIGIPGDSAQGLARTMAKDGAKVGPIRFHQGPGGVQRGYYRNAFDEAFSRFGLL